MFKLLLCFVFLLSSFCVFSQVGIGTTSPNASSNLDLTSSSKGFLLSRMTLIQRNTIISPGLGLQVWCTDCSTNGVLQIFNGTSWVNTAGIVVTPINVPSAPANPVATVLGYTSASVSFSPSTNNGGSISNYTITSSPGGFSFTGTDLSYVFTGLSSGVSYTFSVVATNSAGTTPAVVTSPVVTYALDGNAVCDGTGFLEYSELTSSTGRVWMDRNLGAKRAATSPTDNFAYGCLYQWGRGNDGHSSINWSTATAGTPINGTNTTLSATISPSNATFVTNSSTPNDWLSSQDNSLWQYSSSTNNPCPTGFIIPTVAEFSAEFSAYAITNPATAFSSGPTGGFKFVTPGTRSGTNGSLVNTGTTGSYWTQSINSTSATGYTIASTILSESNNRANGLSVRCVKGAINTSTIVLITYPQDGKVLLQYNAITSATDYIIYYKLNSNTAWTIYTDGVSTTAGATIVGLSNGALYDFKVQALFSNYLPLYSSVASATPTTNVSSNIYHQILTTGQSLTLGYSPSLTTTQVFSNKMLNSSLTSLLPLTEPITYTYAGQESKSSAMANFISNSSINSNGIDFKSIVLLAGQSGTAYSGLKIGTTPYNNGLLRMGVIKNILQSQGTPYVVSAFTVIHGESDNSTGVSSTTYKTYLEEWQHDLETDSKLLTGQTTTIPMFLCQLSSCSSSPAYDAPRVAIGQLLAAEANPTKFYLVTPKYMFDYYDSNQHIDAYSTRRLGEYYGKVMKKVLVDGVAWKPLSPSTVSISANVITINFNVPVAPLQFDTTKVLAASNYGFEYFDATNSATITNVAIGSNGTSVNITLNTTPTGVNKKIAYAYTGVRGGRYSTTSAKGNLRDSDTTPALYTTNLPTNFGTELNNWCVHFIKDLK